MSAAVRLLVAAAVLALTTAGCRVDRARYEQQLYACDSTQENADQQCGAGEMCAVGHALGTGDFCAPECAAPDGGLPANAGYRCIEGARVDTCTPGLDGGSCGPGLSCERTKIDAAGGSGLCLPAEVCSADTDCHSQVRSRCLSTVLSQGLPRGAADDLWCVQAGCNDLAPCAAGYACLGSTFLSSAVESFCVPACDRDAPCPPAFSCASRSFPLIPYNDVCVLGLVGLPCRTSPDSCLVGTCTAIGSVTACTLTCATDADCKPYSTREFPLHCATRDHICVSTIHDWEPTLCDLGDPSTCPTQCVQPWFLPELAGTTLGVCTAPCTTAAECQPDGGLPVPMGCRYPTLAQPDGGTWGAPGACAPGGWSTRCEDDSNCQSGLTCLPGPSGVRICTRPCTADSDCTKAPLYGTIATCSGAADGGMICR